MAVAECSSCSLIWSWGKSWPSRHFRWSSCWSQFWETVTI